MRTLPRYALAVPALAVLALAACGQKGPLVLPSKSPATKVLSTTAPAAPEAAPAAAAAPTNPDAPPDAQRNAKPDAKKGDDSASPPKR
ncbi:MAG: lipoprotein [Proteobacteria bacterium]|nr:lipoprotein [Pseudomonadota bacterium]